jgi:dimethylargininase
MVYKQAIVRKPGKNFADGITTSDLGQPDFDLAIDQHQQYCNALKSCGLKIVELKADVNFPDGCFVEDVAIVTDRIAIITIPGNVSRNGEQFSVSQTMFELRPLYNLKQPGTVDGGDILRVENHFYIGRSNRTNEDGSRQLSNILNSYGFTTSEILVSEGLHLKSSVTYIGDNTIVATEQYAPFFPGMDVVVVGEDESYAANCLQVNNHTIISSGFPELKKKLTKKKRKLIELDMSEFRKMDGSLTCLSLLF